MKNISILIILCLFSLYLYSQCDGNCGNGYGIEKMGEETYAGFFEDSLFHGRGYYIYSNGDYYYGKWEKGMKHGFGLYVWDGGVHYFGNYEAGIKKGKGILVSSDDHYSAGIWDNETLERASTDTHKKNPETCQGNCFNGLGFNVQGGIMYAGIWEKAQFNFGKAYNDNIVQIGYFRDSKIVGFGYERTAEGSYLGYFINGLKDGHGTLYFEDGDYYIGNFENGSCHGRGEYHYANTGDYFTGKWENGKSEGQATWYQPGKGGVMVIFKNGEMIYP